MHIENVVRNSIDDFVEIKFIFNEKQVKGFVFCDLIGLLAEIVH